MIEYIFPFNQVNKGEKVIIYGYGNIGRSYVEQILSTGYCELVAVADKMAGNLMSDAVHFVQPIDIIKENFDKIVIAIQNEKSSREVRDFLLGSGVEKGKILSACKRIRPESTQLPYIMKSAYNDDIIHVGVEGGGGLGDVVLTLPFLIKINEILGDKLVISFFTKYNEILKYTPIKDCFVNKKSEYPCDVYLRNLHIPLVMYWDPTRTKKISSFFYDYLSSLISFRKMNTGRVDGDFLWHYARVLNKKRFNICDFDNSLGIEDTYRKIIECPDNEVDILKKYGLYKKTYIVVNRDVDILRNMANIKLWPAENYSYLLGMIKTGFNDIDIVRVGFRTGEDNINNIDNDLTGKTSLGELIVILKNSRLLISSEGGLVHLNHFAGGKSAVIYGPTDEKYFGYEDDIICVDRSPCSLPCQYVTEDTACPIQPGIPQCMKNVTPKMVYESIFYYLSRCE